MTTILQELDEVLAAETGYQRAIAAGDFFIAHALEIRAALELQAKLEQEQVDKLRIAVKAALEAALEVKS